MFRQASSPSWSSYVLLEPLHYILYYSTRRVNQSRGQANPFEIQILLAFLVDSEMLHTCKHM